ICMEHPEFEIIENDDEISIHFRRITPIYPATEGLSQRTLRGLIYRALESLASTSVETLMPPGVNLGERIIALRQIHFPARQADLDPAREHLVVSDLSPLAFFVASLRS